MTLAEIQRRVAEAIFTPLTKADGIAKKTRQGRSMQAEADELIQPNDRLNSLERLQIYNRCYWYRVLDSLYDDFPGLAAIVGQRAFSKLSEAYLAECPSESFTLRDLGWKLEAWLRANPQYAGRNLELALDMTRLEWAHIEAFDKADRKPLGPEDLIEVGPDLRFGLQPHVSLLEAQYPVDDLRIEISEESEEHDTASNSIPERRRRAIHKYKRLKPKRIYLAVHRLEFTVYYRRLDPEQFRALVALRAGKPLGEAIESALEGSAIREEDLAATVQGWFASWAHLGLFCKSEEM